MPTHHNRRETTSRSGATHATGRLSGSPGMGVFKAVKRPVKTLGEPIKTLGEIAVKELAKKGV